MSWLPIGPDFVFAPRNANFRRLSRRNENGRQGLVARIAIEPGAPGTIYTVVRPTSGGVGLFRADAAGSPGEQWTSLLDGLQQANSLVDPSFLAINPVTPTTVFLATYDDQSVYMSLDRGATWGPRLYVGGRIKKLLIDPRTASNPAATVLYAATDAGLFRSANSGSSWTNVLDGDVWCLCATMPFGGPDGFYAGVLRSGLWFTTDPTGSWTNLNTADIGLPAYSASGPGVAENFNVVYADLCPRNPTRVYLLTLQPNSATDSTPVFGTLYTTASAATAWTSVTTPAPPQPLYGFYPFFGVYDFAFAVAPNSPGDGTTDVLFFGSLNFARSIDSGRTWASPPQILHADHHGFSFYPEVPGAGVTPTVYIGCDGGLAVSDRYCDPTVDITVAPPDFDELGVYTDTPLVQNFNHGSNTAAIYSYASDATVSALQYTAAQDTGVAAGLKTGGWRGIADADATQVAIAAGTDGVKVWVDLGSFGDWPSFRVLLFTDTGDYAPLWVFVTYGPSGSPVAADSRFVVGLDHLCVLGMETLDPSTTLAAAVAVGLQAALPASMAGITVGTTLLVGSEVVIVTAVNATTFTANFAAAHAVGTTVQARRATVGRLDQSGGATRISQDFGNNNGTVNMVAAGPAAFPVGYCATNNATNQPRVWTTPNLSVAGPTTTWTEVAANRPAGLSVAAIVVAAGGAVYVLGKSPVTSGGITTPLFAVGGGTWIPQSFSSVPGGTFGPMVADPIQSGVLYVGVGDSVYKLTLSAGTWTWTDISDNLAGQLIYDMWLANVGTPAAPKVMLRVAIPTRGVWELDVAVPPGPLPIQLYMRDSFLDQGLLPISPDGIPSPYAPSDPTQIAYHYLCADIKIDARQPASGGAPAFFQTDPEGGELPISHVAFDAIRDNSQNLPQSDAALVHVQVRNHSLTVANKVSVWAIYANAAGHVPALSASSSLGDAFPFWSQFHLASGVASIVPALPADSPWTAVGSPIVLSGIDAAHPGIASWNWTVPLLSTGDPGHFCVAVFVHSADDPMTETAMDVDTITPRNRLIAQKNLHIGAPLSPGPAVQGRPMREYIEFHNPLRHEAAYDLVFDLRGLPRELAASLQFTQLQTLEPLERSIHGIAGTRDGGPPPRITDIPQVRRVIQLPEFAPQIYDAHPSARVMVFGVRLAAMGKAACYLTITNTGVLAPGSEYRFTVRQVDQQGTH
ncbi:MAG TPA: hypothetical protein VNY55_00520, partial [Mycobacterium sp.]|nr:hypothetical protein [Mycobacterium sp.]